MYAVRHSVQLWNNRRRPPPLAPTQTNQENLAKLKHKLETLVAKQKTFVRNYRDRKAQDITKLAQVCTKC